jgi:hypothetical protein
MAFPAWLQIIITRLRFLGKPLPLTSSLMAVILGIFIWEYATHPEWFGAYTQEETLPNSTANLSGLTPEEQAAIAEIDNLALLMNEFGSPLASVTSTQNVSELQANSQNTLLQDVLALARPADNAETTASGSPFDRYLAQYQFLGRSFTADSADRSLLQGQRAGDAPAANNESESLALRPRSPLEAALQNQMASEAALDLRDNQANSESLETEARSSATAEMVNQEPAASATSTLSETFNSQVVTIPGVPYPVLPTMPQMSPPPGTTGYTPPASLELIPPLPGAAGSAFPSSSSSNLNPSRTGIPSLPTGNSSVNLGTPQVDVGNGYVTPYTPLVPVAAPTTVPRAAASPFSVPRPPGSYIGGGYINTFANPSGPPN